MALTFVSGNIGALEPVFWPRDLLSPSLRDARVLTWGYSPQIGSASPNADRSHVLDHAEAFLNDLATARVSPLQVARPLILVSHSLGGIVVKDALSQAEAAKQKYHQDLLYVTVGVCFVGTPHRGSPWLSLEDIAFGISTVGFGCAHTTLWTSASRNALALQRVSKAFAELLEDAAFQVHSLGEGRTTRGVPLVDAYSSRIGIDEEEFDEIASDHATMSRFVSADDPGYHKMQSVLSRWTEDARTSRSA